MRIRIVVAGACRAFLWGGVDRGTKGTVVTALAVLVQEVES